MVVAVVLTAFIWVTIVVVVGVCSVVKVVVVVVIIVVVVVVVVVGVMGNERAITTTINTITNTNTPAPINQVNK